MTWGCALGLLVSVAEVMSVPPRLGEPGAKQLEHIPCRLFPGSRSVWGKQCKPPQPTFFTLEAGSAAQSAKQQHCDVPHHSPNEWMTLG